VTIYLESSRPRISLRRRVALAFVFLWFFIGGLAHFVFTSAELQIVPPYIPYALAVVYISGFFELLGAYG
jgi:uncharacterized membrane protein